MKKILCLILALVLSAALLGCGEKTEAPAAGTPAAAASNQHSAGAPEPPAATEETAVAEPGLYFRSGEVILRLSDPIDEVTAALGEPNGGTFESPSCAYQGSDYYYYYDSLGLELTANEVSGTVCLTAITVIDDTVTTPEGLRIGMSAAEAETCGLAFTREENFLSCTVGTTRLRLQLDKNDTVCAINYSLVG